MKKVEELFSYEILLRAFTIAFKGRKKTYEVIRYQFELEKNLCNLHLRLCSFTYTHSNYSTFIVNDSKKRVIHAPCFEDHIVHHCIYEYLEHIFEPYFIFHSYANRKGKGTHRAVLCLKKASVRFRYFLKMDISKYFDSISQDILLKLIEKKVSSDDALWYIRKIVYSFNASKSSCKRGIPIGAVTSQLFANIYLHELDRYIEHHIKVMLRRRGEDLFYIRYVDDFILLGSSKKSLLEVQEMVLQFLEERLELRVHPSKRVLNSIKSGIPFLGYVIYNNRLKVRNDTLRRFKRKVKRYADDEEKKFHSLMSFKGHICITNTKLLSSLESSLLIVKR